MPENEATTAASTGDTATTRRAKPVKGRLTPEEIEPRRLEHERRAAGPAKYNGGGQ